MLETTPPFPAMLGETRTQARASKALHAFGWNDLTARINAARDLREVLKQDVCVSAASFTDAAAGYFAIRSDGKRPVNHDALRHGKASECMENADSDGEQDAVRDIGHRE